MIINKRNFNNYLKKHDRGMLQVLKKWAVPRFDNAQSHRWHLESPQKRFTYWLMYRDLFTTHSKRIVDVGAGYNGYSFMLSAKHMYTAVEKSYIAPAFRVCDTMCMDWYDYEIIPDTKFDVVVANDLFPNVDQRLSLFIDKFLPQCREMRLSLTFFDKTPRWYDAKRVHGDEVLCVCGWSTGQLITTLIPYQHAIDTQFDSIRNLHSSIFDNGRQVAIVKLKGGLW